MHMYLYNIYICAIPSAEHPIYLCVFVYTYPMRSTRYICTFSKVLYTVI